MFDWFWEFLYKISRSIFELIDGLMECANKLCGIENITVEGESTDFISYLFSSQQVMFAFAITSLLGIIILVFFTIYAILRNIVHEKPDMTTGQICVKAFKSLLTFLFVPFCMLALVLFLNVFMEAVYKATSMGGNSLGSFLFVACGQDYLSESEVTGFLNGTLDYRSIATVEDALDGDISNFGFFFSWISGATILATLASALLIFVDRAISLVILFIVSPFSIASSVVDDGAHFKLWREQVMIKFLVGYGTIIAINVYGLIVLLITSNQVVFFNSDFLNYLAKILLVIGGSLTMKKSVSLIGNLVATGAGTRETMDNMMGFGSMMRGLKSAVAAPLAITRGLGSAAQAAAHPFDTLGSGLKSAFNVPSKTGQDKMLEAQGQTNQFLAKLVGKNEGKSASGSNPVSDAIKNGSGDSPSDSFRIPMGVSTESSRPIGMANGPQNNSSKITDALKSGNDYKKTPSDDVD